MPANSSKPGKHLSVRATFLICLGHFSTDITNITAETKNIRILLTEYESCTGGSPPETILQRIGALREVHNRLKERLDIYFSWFDQLTERGQLKDSMLVPKKYHVTEVKGKLQAFLRQWHALRSERKGMEAELEAKDGGDVDAIHTTSISVLASGSTDVQTPEKNIHTTVI